MSTNGDIYTDANGFTHYPDGSVSSPIAKGTTPDLDGPNGFDLHGNPVRYGLHGGTTPNSFDDELDEILALVKYEVEYAETHGGCPPAVRGIKRHGVAEAKQALKSLYLTHRYAELEKLLEQQINPTPTSGYVPVSAIKAAMQEGGAADAGS